MNDPKGSTIKSYLDTKLTIQPGYRYKPRAGVVLVRNQDHDHDHDHDQQPYVLLIKEKGGGKRWGFPKGGVEYRCQKCRVLIRRDNQDERQQVCPMGISKDSVHELEEETIFECGQRELLEETHWLLQPEDQVLFIRKTSNCYYMVIQTEQIQAIKICPKEISTFCWISLLHLIEWACKSPMSFNYGARLMAQQLYDYWYLKDQVIFSDIKYQRFPRYDQVVQTCSETRGLPNLELSRSLHSEETSTGPVTRAISWHRSTGLSGRSRGEGKLMAKHLYLPKIYVN